MDESGPGRAKKAIYAGSFDPVTAGHMFMIREGARLFDELIVAVGTNPEKRTTFSLGTRLELLRDTTCCFENVTVAHFERRFLIDYAAEMGADYMLRGIRNSNDFLFEQTMRNVNGDLDARITTVFLMPPRELAEVSSSFVRGLVGPEGWQKVVEKFVPPPVYQAFLEKFAQPGEEVS